MSTIPASELVNVAPSVIAAGGAALDVIEIMLTQNPRPPVGSVLSFPNAAAVAAFFGGASVEAILAGIYFEGFEGADASPEALLFAQYNSTAVPAYIRGGNVSGLTLAQIQAINGTLAIMVDGYTRSGAVNLSTASSFSAAAADIATALNTSLPTEASVTASIAAETASFTASIAGNVMTVTAVASGTLVPGMPITGTGVTANTIAQGQLTGTPGGIGTYAVSIAQVVASETITGTYGLMTVTAVGSGTLAVGQTLTGSGVTANTMITGLGTGTGGMGTYYVDFTQTVGSEAITAAATAVTVTYGSQLGAFIITSGAVGPTSMVAFPTTSATATALGLTQAAGATLSQGAAPAQPAAFMNALILVNQDWVTFQTLFDPDGGSGNAQKQLFAQWKNTQNNRFAYLCWDNDVTPTESVPATSSLGYILANDNDSGTALLWTPDNVTGPELAAFVGGAAASIDFTATNGRITFAYKAQAGLTATVTDPTTANNLAGSPQTSSFGNGYNFYGAYASANQGFTWFQRGTVTGPYQWLDSYINQIWLNNAFQLALLEFLGTVKSIPYTAAGNSLIEQVLADPIAAGLNFGAFAPGTISAAQAAEVNAAAGTNIATTLQTQGWYLQILPASSAVRAARGSPPMTFWYLDRGSVQAMNLASVAVQ